MAKVKAKSTTSRSRVSARSRIALGLVFLLVSVLFLAMAIGIIPSERTAALANRAQFCEAVAVVSSMLVQKGDQATLRQTLEGMVARNHDVESAGLRQEDGKFVAEVGDHQRQWNTLSGQAALEAYVHVPIFAGDKRWGSVELRFRPITRDGLLSYLHSPQTKLILFISTACLGLFLLYLRKMLQHLDPARAVPSRVRSALDTLAEGLLVLDNQERVVLANQTFADLVGKPPEELLGRRAESFNWIRPDSSVELPWTNAIRFGSVCRGVTLRLDDVAGVRHSFSSNCSPVMGHNGQYRGVLVSLDDVTQMELQEQELRKARDAADAANHAKSEFLARMSHEIRTPMNAILGFAEVLRRGFVDGEAQRDEYLQTIHTSGQHLLELINDILDLSKIEAGKMEIERVPCSPATLVQDVVSVLSIRAREKGLTLAVEWDGPAPTTITTDPTRLRQALTNVVGNAIKFTASGSVRVVTKLLNDGAESKLQLRVIDSGVGIKADALSRIFTPFAQADSSITRKHGGTGLGLSISKQIAEALGGSLTVQSAIGHGSTFSLEVATGSLAGVALVNPSATPVVTLEGAAEPAGLPAQLAGTRVLLVEDGESNRKLATLVLTRAGAKVDHAEDGSQGVEKAMSGRYDVVLMDMQMPVMDGYTAASLLRQKGYLGPIIAVTAHAMRGDADKCRAAGCSGFLTKPIDMDQLVRTVCEAASHRGVPSDADVAADAPPVPKHPATAAEQETTGDEISVVPPTASDEPLNSSLPTDDPEFCEIIAEFVDRMRQQLGSMQTAWASQDLAELAALAHWVKGSGGTAGFNALTAPALELEMAAREQRLDDISQGIENLRRLADRMVTPPVAPANTSNDLASARN